MSPVNDYRLDVPSDHPKVPVKTWPLSINSINWSLVQLLNPWILFLVHVILHRISGGAVSNFYHLWFSLCQQYYNNCNNNNLSSQGYSFSDLLYGKMMSNIIIIMYIKRIDVAVHAQTHNSHTSTHRIFWANLSTLSLWLLIECYT